MVRTVPATVVHTVRDSISPATWAAGPVASFNFLSAPPIFMGYLSGTQSIPNNTNTAIGFNNETVDSDSGHSNVTNNSRYTCQVAGWYAVAGVASFATNGTGTRTAQINKNGLALTYPSVSENTPPSTDACSIATPLVLVQLVVSDYVELVCAQTSGGSLSTASTTRTSCGMSLWWVAHV